MVEALAAMRSSAMILCAAILGGGAWVAGCGGGAHELRYAPPTGASRGAEVAILRQSPTGLLAARIRGVARVLEARGDTRRISFEVESAEVTENGRPITEDGHLGALTRMAGVEIRFVLDAEARLLNQPTVHGARDEADAAVHIAVLDDLVQAGGAFAPDGVDVGESWSHPWVLHGFTGAELDGQLTSTLVSHDGTTAEVALAGTLEMPRQELEGGWTVEGEGRARGMSRLSVATGMTQESSISIRVDTRARTPDGIESDLTIVAELWLRDADGGAEPPPESLLACDTRLRDIAAPTLSPSPAAEDLSFSRVPGNRVASARGVPVDVPGVVVRLERDFVYVDGVVTGDVLLWAHESVAARGVVYLDVAPEVPAARVAEVAAVMGAPRLLVGGPTETLDVGALVSRVEALAGQCTAASEAARLAVDDDLLRQSFSFVYGLRAAIGACGCDVGDLGAMLELVDETQGALLATLRYLPLPNPVLATVPEGAVARELPELLTAPTAPEEPVSAEESK